MEVVTRQPPPSSKQSVTRRLPSPSTTTTTTTTTTREPRDRSTTQRPREVTPSKSETSENDINNFFGGPTETIASVDNDAGRLFAEEIKKNKFTEELSESSHDFNDIISHKPSGAAVSVGGGDGGVLGLFEMMGKINKEATQNFDVVKLPTQTDNSITSIKAIQQQLRLEEMQKKFRLEQIDKIKADEEELRKQQMEKLKLFNLFKEEEAIHKKQLNDQNKFDDDAADQKKFGNNKFSAQSFDTLQGWNDGASWEKTIKPHHSDKPDDNGVAYASITIENVDLHDDRDYHVNNGIVTLNKDDTAPGNVEFEYEYYEADPDDIRFPVGGTRQFYESQAAKSEDLANNGDNNDVADDPLSNIDQLSNKELLQNLLQASNNFQNRDFLDRLKSIVTGSDGEGKVRAGLDSRGGGGGSVTRGGVGSVNTDSWAGIRLENAANTAPIWPANSNFISASGTATAGAGDTFQPSNSFRFPNRRMDADYQDRSNDGDTLGVGEISLVSDGERKRITSVGGFPSSSSSSSSAGRYPVGGTSQFYESQQSTPLSQSSFSSSHSFPAPSSPSSPYSASKISDRLDFTSDDEFLVGTSLTMGQGGHGSAAPVPSSDLGLRAGQQSAARGSEVFRLGSGVQIQRPGHAAAGGHTPLIGEIR